MLQNLACNQTVVALVSAIDKVCEELVFFSGGQAHGSLKKACVGSAMLRFCHEELDDLAAACFQWGLVATRAARAVCGRKIFEIAARCAKIFGAIG